MTTTTRRTLVAVTAFVATSPVLAGLWFIASYLTRTSEGMFDDVALLLGLILTIVPATGTAAVALGTRLHARRPVTAWTLVATGMTATVASAAFLTLFLG